jgi:hypothetical protein
MHRGNASIESRSIRRAALCLCLAAGCHVGLLAAQATGPDYQLRLLAHTQQVAAGQRAGVGAWLILPDLANTRPVRSLLLAGVVIRGSAGSS